MDDDLDAGRPRDRGPAVAEGEPFGHRERGAFAGRAADEHAVDLPGEQMGGLALHDVEVQAAVPVERRVGGRAEAMELEGGHRVQRRSSETGLILRTSQAERQATAANPAKIRFRGTWWSRSQPNPTSESPPQEMLARFIRP